MSIPQSGGGPITDQSQLAGYLEAGCKPKDDWRIGTEHEKFPFFVESNGPVPYEGQSSIRALLEGMREKLGWSPIMDDGRIIGLYEPTGMGAISLEPGGQFELSGAPLESIHQTCRESNAHLSQLRQIADPLGIKFLGLGASPKWTLDETPRMPKSRYDIMRAYMPKVGTQGLDMMHRTSTIQVNLDFSSEADMRKKMQVAYRLQPVATALFANSPFTEGKPNGYLSYRSHIWSDTDPHRTGMLPFVFEDGFGYERWVDYMLDVPMYFVFRDGKYIDAAGLSFRDFLDGKLSVLPGEKPTQSDWWDHLSTAFPEVRLKSFLEMRGADGGPWSRICALPAFWVGLLYEQSSLDAAWDLVKDWTVEEREDLRNAVPKLALDAPIPGGGTLRDLAKQVLPIARSGLAKRARLNSSGDNETGFLETLDEIVASGRVPAQVLLNRYHGEWGEDISRVYKYSF